MSGHILQPIMQHPMAGKVMAGALESKWGEGTPSILEQIIASGYVIEGWLPGDPLSPAYQTQDTSTPADTNGDPVDRINGFMGLFPLYARGTTRRPTLSVSSGLTGIQTSKASSQLLTSDTAATETAPVMAAVMGTTLVRISAFRILTNPYVNLDRVFGSARQSAGELYTRTGSALVSMYSGTFNDVQASVAPNEDVVLTEVFNGASSFIRKNGVQVDTGNPGSADTDAFTMGAMRSLGTISNYCSVLWRGSILCNVSAASDADFLTLAEGVFPS
jgi:hypothetical protein